MRQPGARQWVLGLLIGLAGCGVVSKTAVHHDHPLVRVKADAPSAEVYLMRPHTERAMGYADNALTVRLDDRPLATVDKGEYTLVHVRPRLGAELVLTNQTTAGAHWEVIDKTRRYRFDFRSGETYFIFLTPFDGEFRGVHFVAEEVDPRLAQKTARGLRAMGPAVEAPIADQGG